MARIRTIKPEFWTDDKLTECSLSARLLFIGTWNFADDAGNLDRSAKQIKARVFPVDNVDCEPLIRELITHGLLIEYSCNGKNYLHIQGFAKHQVINRPSSPQCPEFEDSLIFHGTLSESSLNTHAGRKGKEGKDKRTHADAFDAMCVLSGLGVNEQHIIDWLKIRKAKRSPLTATAVDGLKREAEKAGYTVAQAVQRCCESGWVGFKAEWVSGQPVQPDMAAQVIDVEAVKAKRKAELEAAREAYREQMKRETVPPVGSAQ